MLDYNEALSVSDKITTVRMYSTVSQIRFSTDLASDANGRCNNDLKVSLEIVAQLHTPVCHVLLCLQNRDADALLVGTSRKCPAKSKHMSSSPSAYRGGWWDVVSKNLTLRI